jgi:8-oxo-dGTP pyrophosphatase MutT (NUDIX family)
LAPVDAREELSVALFAAIVPGLARPFDEDGGPTHVTSSAVIVGSLGVILLKHKRLGIWIQPGGHLEPEEDLPSGAMREATEETGLVLSHPDGGPRMVHVDVHAGGRGHIHLDLRWLLVGSGDPNPPADESQDVGWFDLATATSMTDPGLAGLLRSMGGTRPPARRKDLRF